MKQIDKKLLNCLKTDSTSIQNPLFDVKRLEVRPPRDHRQWPGEGGALALPAFMALNGFELFLIGS